MTTSGSGGGYPPMSTLQGAVPAWHQPWLTAAATREQAAAVLRAEAQTSVLDVQSLRRLEWRSGPFVFSMVLLGLGVLALVEFRRSGEVPRWALLLGPLSLLLSVVNELVLTRIRALPGAGVVPRIGPARWRWRRDLRLQPSVVAPAADWPAGSEAYALLSGAASVRSAVPTWLAHQVGLPPEIGASWIDLLKREVWLTGGGHFLRSSRLPERHVELTDAGRQEFDAERERLRALATS